MKDKVNYNNIVFCPIIMIIHLATQTTVYGYESHWQKLMKNNRTELVFLFTRNVNTYTLIYLGWNNNMWVIYDPIRHFRFYSVCYFCEPFMFIDGSTKHCPNFTALWFLEPPIKIRSAVDFDKRNCEEN